MVRKIVNTVFVSAMFFICGCGFDFLGTAISNDLDERLKERDNFTLLDANGWRSALSSLGGEYSFLVVADPHINNGKTGRFERLKNVIDDPANDIRFAVILGDITEWGTKSDLQAFINVIENQFDIPTYPVIGNHDVYFGNWSNWKELIGSTSYRINAGATTLFIMDNANLYFGKQQMDWLESELRSAGDRVFVFTHAHFFMRSPVGAQHHDINERARFASMLRGRASAVFSGHKHVGTEIHVVGGVRYITLDSFDSGAYLIVKVDGDGVRYDFGNI